MTEHEELADAVAAYVLGSSEPDEMEAVRSHLAGCASCTELARRLSAAAGVLPLALDQVAPPPGLRSRILDSARASAPSLPGTVVRLPARPRRSLQQRLLPVAAAALVAFALGAGLGLGLGRSLGPGQAPTAVGRYTMSGTGTLAGGRADVFDVRGAGYTILDFHGMPTLERGRVYELWLIKGGAAPQPGLVFVPDPDGSKVVVLGRNLSGLAQLAVTVEQGPDGTRSPTQPPEMSAALT